MLTKPQVHNSQQSTGPMMGGQYGHIFSAVSQLAQQITESQQPKKSVPTTGPLVVNFDNLLSDLKLVLNTEVVKKVGYVYLITVLETGESPAKNILLDLKNGGGLVTLCDSDELNAGVDVHISMTSEVFVNIIQDKVNFASAYMKGEIKLIKGSISQASKLSVLKSKLKGNVNVV